MEVNFTLFRKNLNCSIFFTIFLSVCNSVFSQVLYTDLQPDSVISCQNISSHTDYYLDINNDDLNDFIISHAWYDSLHRSIYMWPLRNNTILTTHYALDQYHPLAIDSLYQICDSSTVWRNNISSKFILSSYAGGQWTGVKNKYLALCIKDYGEVRFGWCKLDVSEESEYFVVKKYACQLSPDTPILAGRIDNNSSLEYPIKVINEYEFIINQNILQILTDNMNDYEISIFSLSGKKLIYREMKGSGNIQLNNLGNYIYILKVKDENMFHTQKILLR